MSGSINKTARILVIDDDPSMSTLVQGLLSGATTCLTSALTIADGVRLVAEQRFDIIVLDHLLPDGLGLDHIQQFVATDRLRPILYITAQSGAHTAIEAIKRGAFDYLTKPINFSLFKKRLHEALEYRNLTRLPVLVENAPSASNDSDVLIGRCRAMQEVYKNIGRLANLSDAVLIEGEVGTGKEMIARAIHSYGPRQQAKFLKISSEELSEAIRQADKATLDECFPQCRGGTLLVEEISSLSSNTQAKLLASLQYVGPGDQSVRLIISSSIPGRQLLERGLLRSDLYYFLSPYTVRVPALRDREDDLELLVTHFMQRLALVSATNENQGPPRVSASALSLLRQHDWPGNVAHLKSVLQTALQESRGAVLASAALHQALDSGRAEFREVADKSPSNHDIGAWDLAQFVEERCKSATDHLYDDATAELDRAILTLVLRRTHGNQAQAAKILGMTRTSLRKKIVATQIDLSRLSDSEANDDVNEIG